MQAQLLDHGLIRGEHAAVVGEVIAEEGATRQQYAVLKPRSKRIDVVGFDAFGAPGMFGLENQLPAFLVHQAHQRHLGHQQIGDRHQHVFDGFRAGYGGGSDLGNGAQAFGFMRATLHLTVQPRVVDQHGRLTGENRKDARVVFREVRAVEFVGRLDHAEPCAANAQRRHDHLADADLRRQSGQRRILRVHIVRNVVAQPGVALLPQLGDGAFRR